MNQTTPNVKIIPAVVKPIEKTNKYKQLRVAAYCRVSTEQEEQQFNIFQCKRQIRKEV